jgi:hypothetical protein
MEDILRAILNKPDQDRFYIVATSNEARINADLRYRFHNSAKGVLTKLIALGDIVQDSRVEYLITRGGWSTLSHDIALQAGKAAFIVTSNNPNNDRLINANIWARCQRGRTWFEEYAQHRDINAMTERLIDFEHKAHLAPMQKECLALKQALVGPAGQEMDRKEWMKLLVMIHKRAGLPQEHAAHGQAL